MKCSICNQKMINDRFSYFCNNPDCKKRFVDVELIQQKQRKMGEYSNE
jgi:hypothetical protein